MRRENFRRAAGTKVSAAYFLKILTHGKFENILFDKKKDSNKIKITKNVKKLTDYAKYLEMGIRM